MDDRTWHLVVATLSVAAGALVLDAPLEAFEVPGGFWTVLAAALGVLGVRAVRNGKNGNGNGNGGVK